MGPVLAMAAKDLRLLVRDRMGFFFVFFFPTLYAIFFGFIGSAMRGGGDEGLPALAVIVVDSDGTEGSKAFVDRLDAAPELNVLRLASRDEAQDRVRGGKSPAYVVLKPGFGEGMKPVLGGEPPEVELGVDPSRAAESAMLRGLLTKHTSERFFALAESFGFGSGGAADDENPSFESVRVDLIEVSDENRGQEINPWAISFPQGIVWGLMGAALGFAIGLVVERRQGTLARLQMSPVGSRRILAGKAVACFVSAVGVTVVLLLLGVVAFGIRPSSYVTLALAVVSTAACFVGLMMFFSVLGRTEAAASGIGWASMCVMAMLGGGMVPLVFLQRVPFLSALSHVSPVKRSILALEGALWRGFSVAEMAVPCIVLLAMGAGAFGIGVMLFRRLEST